MLAGKIQLIAGRSHPQLAAKISRLLRLPLTPIESKTFANGETYVRILKKVRNDDVFLIQTLSPPVNEHLMEMLVAIDALKRASAGRINVVCPHFAYARQDRKAVSREPITAKLVADLITTAGADRLVTVDLHAAQIQGFFNIPVDHFAGYPQFARRFTKDTIPNPVVVTPDVGGARRAREMACLLHCPVAVIDKRRNGHNCVEGMNLIGDVKNKTAVIVDDMIDTAGTITGAADALADAGARDVIICATHGLFSGPSFERLEKCQASRVCVLDTVPVEKKKLKKLRVYSLSPLLAKVIRRIHLGQSLGSLFDWEQKVNGA